MRLNTLHFWMLSNAFNDDGFCHFMRNTLRTTNTKCTAVQGHVTKIVGRNNMTHRQSSFESARMQHTPSCYDSTMWDPSRATWRRQQPVVLDNIVTCEMHMAYGKALHTSHAVILILSLLSSLLHDRSCTYGILCNSVDMENASICGCCCCLCLRFNTVLNVGQSYCLLA